jgi:hypothetical protein
LFHDTRHNIQPYTLRRPSTLRRQISGLIAQGVRQPSFLREARSLPGGDAMPVLENHRGTAEKWGRIIAEAYAADAQPALSPEGQRRLASLLANHLNPALVSHLPSEKWVSSANHLLQRWERLFGGRGPRIASLDEVAETVRMDDHRSAA